MECLKQKKEDLVIYYVIPLERSFSACFEERSIREICDLVTDQLHLKRETQLELKYVIDDESFPLRNALDLEFFKAAINSGQFPVIHVNYDIASGTHPWIQTTPAISDTVVQPQKKQRLDYADPPKTAPKQAGVARPTETFTVSIHLPEEKERKSAPDAFAGARIAGQEYDETWKPNNRGPCPLCSGPFHFPYQCPIVCNGIQTMIQRKNALLENNEDVTLIAELKELIYHAKFNPECVSPPPYNNF